MRALQAIQSGLMPDYNWETALIWANRQGPTPALPESLANVVQRARLVNAINGPFMSNLPQGDLRLLSAAQIQERLALLATLSLDYIPDCTDADLRTRLALKLWSGCISAEKTVALDTMDGVMTAQERSRIFSQIIDPIARTDEIYRAGVEAGPAFKELNRQEISLEGVPADSSVRRYVETSESGASS